MGWLSDPEWAMGEDDRGAYRLYDDHTPTDCTFCGVVIKGEAPVIDDDGRPFCGTDCVGHFETEKAGA